GGQREPLLRGRLVDATFDFEVVPIEVGEANAIADQGQVLRAPIALPKIGARIVAQPLCAKVARRRCPTRAKRERSRNCGCSRNCERRGFALQATEVTLGKARETAEAASQETCRHCRPTVCRESARSGIPSWRRSDT